MTKQTNSGAFFGLPPPNALRCPNGTTLPIAINRKSRHKMLEQTNRYRLNFWSDIMSDDSTSELMNVLGMMLSMVGILLKYKTCAWFGIVVAAVSYANARSNHDNKQIMSTFMLSISSVVMCYLINPAPISYQFSQANNQHPLDAASSTTVSPSAATTALPG